MRETSASLRRPYSSYIFHLDFHCAPALISIRNSQPRRAGSYRLLSERAASQAVRGTGFVFIIPRGGDGSNKSKEKTIMGKGSVRDFVRSSAVYTYSGSAAEQLKERAREGGTTVGLKHEKEGSAGMPAS